jgi:hypothetical protein
VCIKSKNFTQHSTNLTRVAKDTGKTSPGSKNSKLNYVDILITHEERTNEERDPFLVVNGQDLSQVRLRN